MREFTRTAWTSMGSRDVWEPRVRTVSQALLTMEVESVRQGLRPAALQFTPDVASLRRFGTLAFAPVAPGRCVVALDQPTVTKFLAAWRGHDDLAVGHWLGFPDCCCGFFHHVWNTLKYTDTTLSMADDDQPGFPAANILGRWLGVRLVPHLPCAWTCTKTHAFAKALAPCWDPQALAWANEMLSWPVEYSALHGIAIVTFPVLKVVTNTDYTAGTRRIQRQGTRYPDEAATGLQFPFQKPHVQTMILKKPSVNPSTWLDNGFPTLGAMNAAHEMILNDIGTAPGLEIIDLGCGNGRLLDKIPAVFKVGVEVDADRAAAGMARGLDIRIGRIQDVARLVPQTFGLAMISQRRLEEFTPEELVAFHAWAKWHVAELLIYSYDAPMFVRRETPCLA